MNIFHRKRGLWVSYFNIFLIKVEKLKVAEKSGMKLGDNIQILTDG